MIIDLHVHTCYSFDSYLKPKKLIKTAIKKGFDAVAILDHNTIKGALAAIKQNPDKKFKIIPGCEISTEIGEIGALFISMKPKSKNSIELIEEIKDLGGISVLTHPFRGHSIDQEIINKIDSIEVFNSHTGNILNLKAFNLAKKFNKPFTAGSDAHLAVEIGTVKLSCQENIYESILKNNLKILELKTTYNCIKQASQIIKAFKMKNFKTIIRAVSNSIKSPVKLFDNQHNLLNKNSL